MGRCWSDRSNKSTTPHEILLVDWTSFGPAHWRNRLRGVDAAEKSAVIHRQCPYTWSLPSKNSHIPCTGVFLLTVAPDAFAGCPSQEFLRSLLADCFYHLVHMLRATLQMSDFQTGMANAEGSLGKCILVS